jgi:catechol 2,3-dioxygenase-like lactoylglutathione lyase family enzyme
MTTRQFSHLLPLFTLAALTVATAAVAQGAASPHTVTTTKFTIDDVSISKTFYEDLVGLPELRRFVDEGRLVEPFMGWTENGRMGLLAYTEKESVEKSPYPVSVVFLPDLDDVAARFEAAGQSFEVLSGEATGGVRLSIVRDPSGNAIELVEREGAPAVGGARLIVSDRAEAEEFFVRIFGAEPGQRIENDTFDEVFMDVGEGMFVALFEPKGIAPLAKSENPVVAIYSTEFDAVLERVKAGGLRVRERSAGMFLADDPSGNVVEVVRQAAP